MQTFLTSHVPEHLSDEDGINWLLNKCWEIRLGNAKLSTEYAKEALERSEKIDYTLGIGRSLGFIAFFSFAQNHINKAIPLIDKALGIFQALDNEYEQSIIYVLRGGCHLQIGDYDTGFEDMLKGLEFGRKYHNLQAVATGTYMLGNYYQESGNYEQATTYYEEALMTFTKMNDQSGIATTIAGIGNVVSAMGDYKQALQYHYESLEISEQIQNPQVQARNLHDLGVVYELLGDYDKALAYLNRSLDIRQEKNIIQGIVSCHISMGRVYMHKALYPKAIEALQEAVKISFSIDAKPKLVKAYKVLSDVYKKNQQAWEALEALEKYIELKSMVAGDESNAKLIAIQALHETEIHKLRNTELKVAYEKIESQNQHIIDSIKYARRIQEALLPPPQEIAQYAEHGFIFYRPKDIVSGDFYWFTSQNNEMILACVDCTGHGVPGAFMVVMGISLLEEIVNVQEIYEPTEILSRLDQKVRQALKQDQADSRHTQDGMDLAVVRFCDATKKLRFAGARSSLYHMRAGELQEIKGSNIPIGSSQYVGEKHYEQFEIDFLPNDMFYMSTDGFRDQFGGEDNKKYTKAKFRQLLKEISPLPTQAQAAYLDQEFTTWKAHYTQTDDVLVMGFKIQ